MPRSIVAEQSSWCPKVGAVAHVASGADLKAAEALSCTAGFVVMDALDWQIIPAENLVAAFQVFQ